MEKTYDTMNVKNEYLKLEIMQELETIMDSIEYDKAKYNLDSISYNFHRIFIYPTEKEFKITQLTELTKTIQSRFQFITTRLPKDCSNYDTHKYKWIRDFRKEQGTFMLKRIIKREYKDIQYELFFLIENAPMLNCRLEKKTVEREIYEAICE